MMRYTDFSWHDAVLMLQGLGVSVALFGATTLIGLVIGLAWATLRYYRVPVLAHLAALLAELLKNSPVLVQLFLVFFGLPVLLEMDLTPVQAALITLSGNTAAFIYVIAVAAIESVGRDQLETARVFGLSRWQTLRRVVAPQAAAFALGPLAGLLINQLQVTSLISVIGVVDLTKVGAILNLRTLKPFIVWSVIGLLYYLMARLIAAACARVETRLRAHREWKGL
jgi:glutamine transport system permease protein